MRMWPNLQGVGLVTYYVIWSMMQKNFLLPFRKAIVESENNYYNKDTKILSFPIQIWTVSKGFEDAPPTILYTYAILTEANGLTLMPFDTKFLSVDADGKMVLCLGDCSTRETVYTDIELTNESFGVAQYAFTDLPDVSFLLEPLSREENSKNSKAV